MGEIPLISLDWRTPDSGRGAHCAVALHGACPAVIFAAAGPAHVAVAGSTLSIHSYGCSCRAPQVNAVKGGPSDERSPGSRGRRAGDQGLRPGAPGRDRGARRVRRRRACPPTSPTTAATRSSCSPPTTGTPRPWRRCSARGAEPDRANDRGQTPLAGAVFKGEDAVIRALLAGGSRPGGRARRPPWTPRGCSGRQTCWNCSAPLSGAPSDGR